MTPKPVFSVITPTYNRRHTLPQVFEGLRAQTFTDFEWIVVDDGSTDGTAELVSGWTAPFRIIYRVKPNGGRLDACNFGLDASSGNYVVYLDSDDVPVPEALEAFVAEFAKASPRVGMVGALTMTAAGVVHGSRLWAPVVEITLLDAYARRGMTGDKWLALKANVAREFRFPIFPGEKQYPEGLVNMRISRAGYLTRFIDRPLLVHEYLEDGISRNNLAVAIRNPIGYSAYYTEVIRAEDVELNAFYLKSAAASVAMVVRSSRRPWMTALLITLGLPIGIIKGLLDAMAVRRNSK